ncbi:MAG: UTP11 family protein [archaeon]|nr:UTP11 family protein [archaeon]
MKSRANFRERSQPAARRKLGALEKHKDYKVRSTRRHKTQSVLKALYEKAATKNPDEFYQAMISLPPVSSFPDRDRRGRSYNDDEEERDEGALDLELGLGTPKDGLSKKERLVISNQDIAYLTLHRQADSRKLERMRARLQLIEDKPRPKQHLVFVDSQAEVPSFDPAAHFSTLPELLDRTFNRPTLAQLADPSFLAVAADPSSGGKRASQRPTKRDLKRAERERASAYDELAARAERAERLKGMVAKLQLKKHVIGAKEKPVKVRDEDGVVSLRWSKRRCR